MENILKKGNSKIIAQFHDIKAFEDASYPVHLDLQLVLDKHQSVSELPQ